MNVNVNVKMESASLQSNLLQLLDPALILIAVPRSPKHCAQDLPAAAAATTTTAGSASSIIADVRHSFCTHGYSGPACACTCDCSRVAGQHALNLTRAARLKEDLQRCTCGWTCVRCCCDRGIHIGMMYEDGFAQTAAH